MKRKYIELKKKFVGGSLSHVKAKLLAGASSFIFFQTPNIRILLLGDIHTKLNKDVCNQSVPAESGIAEIDVKTFVRNIMIKTPSTTCLDYFIELSHSVDCYNKNDKSIYEHYTTLDAMRNIKIIMPNVREHCTDYRQMYLFYNMEYTEFLFDLLYINTGYLTIGDTDSLEIYKIKLNDIIATANVFRLINDYISLIADVDLDIAYIFTRLKEFIYNFITLMYLVNKYETINKLIFIPILINSEKRLGSDNTLYNELRDYIYDLMSQIKNRQLTKYDSTFIFIANIYIDLKNIMLPITKLREFYKKRIDKTTSIEMDIMQQWLDRIRSGSGTAPISGSTNAPISGSTNALIKELYVSVFLHSELPVFMRSLNTFNNNRNELIVHAISVDNNIESIEEYYMEYDDYGTEYIKHNSEKIKSRDDAIGMQYKDKNNVVHKVVDIVKYKCQHTLKPQNIIIYYGYAHVERLKHMYQDYFKLTDAHILKYIEKTDTDRNKCILLDEEFDYWS